MLHPCLIELGLSAIDSVRANCPLWNARAEMPRYFFHFKRGQMTILDQEGVDLPDISEAAEEAARRGRAIAARDALKSVPFSRGTIVVEDEWRTIFEVRLEDIMDAGKAD